MESHLILCKFDRNENVASPHNGNEDSHRHRVDGSCVGQNVLSSSIKLARYLFLSVVLRPEHEQWNGM